MISFDSIVFLLTLAKTFKLTLEFRHLGLREGISSIILRDGEWLVYVFLPQLLTIHSRHS